jgi:hydrocephalus-inducing protein
MNQQACHDFVQALPSTRLTGPGYIDVPPLSERNVDLRFYSYVEGNTSAVATFKNEASGEYCFYNLRFTAGPPPAQPEMTLEAPVRNRIERHIPIENPLETAVVLSPTCDNSQVCLIPPDLV